MDLLGAVKLKPTSIRVKTKDGRTHEETRTGVMMMTHSSSSEECAPQYVRDQEAGFSVLNPRLWVDGARGVGGSWRLLHPPLALSSPTTPGTAVPLPLRHLELITYNVWFCVRNKKARATALFHLLEARRPHVICLQEVTPTFLTWLRDEEWVRVHYLLSDSVGTTLRGSTLQYGVLMLIRNDLRDGLAARSLALHQLPSAMNRAALVATLSVDAHGSQGSGGGGEGGGGGGEGGEGESSLLRIATFHLESLDNTPTRCAQLDRLNALLAADDATDGGGAGGSGGGLGAGCSAGGSIMLGDFNCDASCAEEEGQRLDATRWIDCWSSARPDAAADQSFTMPHDDALGRPTRIDRVMSLARSAWRPVSIERIGMDGIGVPAVPQADRPVDRSVDHGEPAAPGPVPVLLDEEGYVAADGEERPSDHYGVYVALELRGVGSGVGGGTPTRAIPASPGTPAVGAV